MAFIEGTRVFTNKGWRLIQDISGHDKVLVKNFLGDAEFIQPFSIKKFHYDGEVVKIGGRWWSISVTPDHKIAYLPAYGDITHEKAENIKVNPKTRILRQFNYINPEKYRPENIVIHTEFGKKWVDISGQDWYVLVAFVLLRGGFKKHPHRKYALSIFLDPKKRDQEIALLADILDRIGVVWSLIPSYTDDRWFIRIGPKSTLPARFVKRLGSHKRKEMYLPDSMIYNGSRELTDALISTIINLSKKPETELGDLYQFSTNNEKLVESLTLMGTIWGYGMDTRIMAKKGQDTGKGALTKDVLILDIKKLPPAFSPTKVEKINYNGLVYEINLFDGQVYAGSGKSPVWTNPK